MEEAAVRFELVDINEILKTLPHRYPMLLIDRVMKIRTDYSGIGIKNVTYNEPPFLGHFPERPVYPGVMMIEAMAVTIIACAGSPRRIASQGAPSGASRSFTNDSKALTALRRSLNSLDSAGLTSALIGADPATSSYFQVTE